MFVTSLDERYSLYSVHGEPRLRDRTTGTLSSFLPPGDALTRDIWRMECEDYAARRRHDARSETPHHRESLICAEVAARGLRDAPNLGGTP